MGKQAENGFARRWAKCPRCGADMPMAGGAGAQPRPCPKCGNPARPQVAAKAYPAPAYPAPAYPAPPNYPMPGGFMPAAPGAPVAAMLTRPLPATPEQARRRRVLLVGAGLGALLLIATVVVVLATSIMGDTVTPEEVRQWPVYRQQNFQYTVRLPAEPSWDPPRLIAPVQRSLNSRSCEHRGRSIGLTVVVLDFPSYGGPVQEFSYSAGVEGVREGTGGTVLWQGPVKTAGQSGYGYTVQAGNRYFSGRMIPAWPADRSRLVYVLEFNDYSEGDKEGVEEYFASFRLK